MKEVKVPKIFWAIIGVSLLLNLVAIVVSLHSAGSTSYPQVQTITKTPAIDYTKIDALIADQINGLQLTSGTNGSAGVTGTAGVNGADGQPGKAGDTGPSGQQGEPGTPGPIVQLRYNTAKQEVEWQYIGDINWKLLVEACTLTNTCEAVQ